MSAAVSAALALAVLLLMGCSAAQPFEPRGSVTPSLLPLRTATAVLEGRGTPVEITVEVADTDEARLRGLMFRDRLAPDRGMAFFFPAGTSVAFHMRDVRIPLSIAFFDDEGRILRVLDMEPCAADPCPSYDPGITYSAALEVQRGAFVRWGLGIGDRIRIQR